MPKLRHREIDDLAPGLRRSGIEPRDLVPNGYPFYSIVYQDILGQLYGRAQLSDSELLAGAFSLDLMARG